MRRKFNTPKIKFIAVKKRLLQIKIYYSVSYDDKLFIAGDIEIFICVPWRKRINVKEFEAYIVEKLQKGKYKKLFKSDYTKIIKAKIKFVNSVFDLKGEL